MDKRVNEAPENGKTLVHSMTKSANDELAKRAFGLARSLDGPFEDAVRTFAETLMARDGGTRGDRLELLRSYRTLVEAQRAYIVGKAR
jgi:hypothetical protein